MIFKIKEKFWSWGKDFTITDELDVDKYRVKGDGLSWGSRLRFQTMDGDELACIEKKVWSWKSRYHILKGDTVYAEVIKEFSLFTQKFVVLSEGAVAYTIEGSFGNHDFEFCKQGKPVVNVSKSLWNWSDHYGVDISDDEDDVTILCICIAIDQLLADQATA